MKTIQIPIRALCLFMIFPTVPEIEFEAIAPQKIIKYFGCEDLEVIADIDYSIEQNLAFLNENDIKVKTRKGKDFCGYLLINRKKKKKLEGAVTDADLLVELKAFYGSTSN